MFPDYNDRSNARGTSSMGRHLSNEIVNRVHRNGDNFSAVDDRIDRLALLCEAMWEVLQAETSITEEDLLKKVHELDELDGRRNFRRNRVAVACECGAKVPPTRLRCQFCGAPAMGRSMFDAV